MICVTTASRDASSHAFEHQLVFSVTDFRVDLPVFGVTVAVTLQSPDDNATSFPLRTAHTFFDGAATAKPIFAPFGTVIFRNDATFAAGKPPDFGTVGAPLVATVVEVDELVDDELDDVEDELLDDELLDVDVVTVTVDSSAGEM